MKVFKFLFLVVIFAMTITGCSVEPEACLTVDKATALVDEPINCDASCSVNGETYHWMAIDGDVDYTLTSDTSNDYASPTATYTFHEPGTFTIKVDVLNGRNSATAEKTVTISE